jgi:hypothetical protein
MEWAKRWGLFNRLREQLETSLGEEAFNAAWERGVQLGMDDMNAEVQILFESKA